MTTCHYAMRRFMPSALNSYARGKSFILRVISQLNLTVKEVDGKNQIIAELAIRRGLASKRLTADSWRTRAPSLGYVRLSYFLVRHDATRVIST